MKEKLKKRYIGDKAFYRMALAIAVPIMIQNGISNFVSMLDNIMVGRVGTEQMTGVAIVNQLIFVYNLMIFGAVSGAGIFGAQFFGSRDWKGVRDTFRFKMISCILLTGLAIVLFWQKGDVLIRLYLQGKGDTEQIEQSFLYARRYLNIMLIGLIPFAVSQCYSGTLREVGETVLPMKAGVAAVLANLCLNTVLIFGLLGFPRMGAAGAAVATVISRFVETAIVVVFTHKKKQTYEFIIGAYQSFKVPGKLVGGILKKGIPLLFNETLWAGGMAMLNQCYSIRSYDAVSAVNISSVITNVFNVSFIAMGSAIGIICGQLLGAGKADEAVETNRKLTFFSLVLCIGFGAGLALVSPFFPLIYNTTDEIRAMAGSFIRISAACMPIGAYANASYFTLRSGGKTLVTVLFDSCYVWVIVVPFAYVLSRFTLISVVMLFLCCQLIEFGKCVVGFFMIRSGIWIQKIVS